MRGRPRVTVARSVAQKVLMRVSREGAWAERALNAILERSTMSPRDCALATDLVYGTLRHQARLDFLLQRVANKPLSKLPAATLVAMRLGAYQIIETRTPDHAVVNEVVALVRERHPRLSGFANAALRRLATQVNDGTLPRPRDCIEDAVEALAVEGSQPRWLVERVIAQLGQEEAAAFVAANNETPPLSLRVNRLRTSRAALAARLREADLDVEEPEGSPDALLLRRAGRVTELPGFADGLFSIQDLAAQLIAPMLAPGAGDVVVDVCAAPGGKSTHLAELMGDKGTVLALEIHRGKTRLIQQNAARLGLTSVTPVAVDATDQQAVLAVLQQHGVAGQTVDAVMLDAPCTGVGTLRRHPELRHVSDAQIAEELPRLCAAQDALLDSVAGLVAPGGVLVYVVCSILEEEGPARVARFITRHPEFVSAPPAAAFLRPFLDESGALRTWPHRHGGDGFFAARLVRH